jgi:23S rRNA pseudouridine1911/1915/1917 synthase
VALVDGVVPWDSGTILLPLGHAPAGRVQIRRGVVADGRPSETRVRVLARFAAHTLVEAVLVTGRQHQARVHLAAAGFPVTGDLLYRDEELFLRARAGGEAAEGLPARHCLHASRVELDHPVTGARVVIDSELPRDFLDFVARAAAQARPPGAGPTTA